MRKYVFFTADIHPVGGMQSYVAGKTKYLVDNSWSVFIFYPGRSVGGCAFPILNNYISGGIMQLKVFPNQLFSNEIKKILKQIKTIIEYTDEDQIYIESHYDKMALWGELFSSTVNGKHVCLNCNEVFRGKHKY